MFLPSLGLKLKAVCVCVCDGSAEILLQICLIKPLSGDTHLELKERESLLCDAVDLRRTHTYKSCRSVF